MLQKYRRAVAASELMLSKSEDHLNTVSQSDQKSSTNGSESHVTSANQSGDQVTSTNQTEVTNQEGTNGCKDRHSVCSGRRDGGGDSKTEAEELDENEKEELQELTVLYNVLSACILDYCSIVFTVSKIYMYQVNLHLNEDKFNKIIVFFLLCFFVLTIVCPNQFIVSYYRMTKNHVYMFLPFSEA